MDSAKKNPAPSAPPLRKSRCPRTGRTSHSRPPPPPRTAPTHHPPMHPLEAVAHIRQSPSDDHAHRVIEVGMPHFGFQAYRKGFFSELLHREKRSLSSERMKSDVGPVALTPGTEALRNRA